jgi:hypothetical protein
MRIIASHATFPTQLQRLRYLTILLTKVGPTTKAGLEGFLPDVWKRHDADDPSHSK